MLDPAVGQRIITKIADRDCDEHDVERIVPAGMVGTIVSAEEDRFDIEWENGAWTCWSRDEIARDARVIV